MRHCRTYLPVLPGLRVQDLEIPRAAAVCQAVLPEPPEGLGCRSAAEVADTVQAGEAEAAEVDEQVLHGEDAQLPARPDDALRQAEGVERGVEQAAEPARSAGLAPLLRHVLVDGCLLYTSGRRTGTATISCGRRAS